MKFRKKPVEIDAWLCRDIIEAFKRDYWAGMPPEVEAEQDRNGYWLVTTPYAPEGEGIYIPTLEGNMFAKPDDMIIMGVKGEFYPCRGDIFEATYEPVV